MKRPALSRCRALLALALLLVSARPAGARFPGPETGSPPIPAPAGGPLEPAPAEFTSIPTTAAQASGWPLDCSYNPATAGLIEQFTAEGWTGWISRLSGEEPVSVGGQPTRLVTRFSYALFDGRSRAFDYLREQVLALYPPDQVELDPYEIGDLTWQNLVLTLPGTSRAEEVVIMSAHFDSIGGVNEAPGADDNASGSAALLEVARLLQGRAFPRTIRLVWFTGEEQGLFGSSAYVEDHDLSRVAGVINLDMFAYDGDNDRCFELHVGTLPSSHLIGQCFVEAIEAYGLDLTYDYLAENATTRSDHFSFWRNGVGAVEVGENLFTHTEPATCGPEDRNPAYHSVEDTLANLNVQTGLSIARAALAVLVSMASPGEAPFHQYVPVLLKSD